MLVVAEDPARRRDLERGEQPLEAAGVLGGDDVGGGELLAEPRRRVARVADRGGREDEGAGAHGAILAAGRGTVDAPSGLCRPGCTLSAAATSRHPSPTAVSRCWNVKRPRNLHAIRLGHDQPGPHHHRAADRGRPPRAQRRDLRVRRLLRAAAHRPACVGAPARRAPRRGPDAARGPRAARARRARAPPRPPARGRRAARHPRRRRREDGRRARARLHRLLPARQRHRAAAPLAGGHRRRGGPARVGGGPHRRRPRGRQPRPRPARAGAEAAGVPPGLHRAPHRGDPPLGHRPAAAHRRHRAGHRGPAPPARRAAAPPAPPRRARRPALADRRAAHRATRAHRRGPHRHLLPAHHRLERRARPARRARPHPRHASASSCLRRPGRCASAPGRAATATATPTSRPPSRSRSSGCSTTRACARSSPASRSCSPSCRPRPGSSA